MQKHINRQFDIQFLDVERATDIEFEVDQLDIVIDREKPAACIV